MSAASGVKELKERVFVFWLARTDQERKLLSIGGAVVGVALVYSLLVAPAVSGRTKLARALPELHQQAAELQAMAAEATELARQQGPAVAQVSRETLAGDLAARNLTPTSLTVSGDFVKLQLTGVPFSSLITWLDAVRREQRLQVEDANIVAQGAAGMVDATISLHQNRGDSANGPT